MNKTVEQKIKRLVEEESLMALNQFNIDCDGYEITDNLRETLEYRDIEVSEETLTYLAKYMYKYHLNIDI